MNIDYLIQLLTNRLAGLALAKDQAFQSGDLERIVSVDAEILDVQNTISKLKLLASIEQTAAVTPFTVSEVVKNGIEASFNPTVVNDYTQPLLDFDITPYATDPYHEIKIQNILEKMGPMDTVDQIEAYIKKANPDSPLSGDMVYLACAKYNVSTRLTLALMELDSRFGTVGLAVSTRNPGNVGNDGVNVRTYASWNDGVEAVAEWLSRHRITKAATVQETVAPTPTSTPPVVPVAPLVTEPTPTPTPTPPAYVQTPAPVSVPTPAATSTPVVETPAPVVETPAPTPTPEVVPTPVVETPAPTPTPEPTPVVETPAPAPVIETPAPVVETPAPTPTPEVVPTPVVETPAPTPTPEPTPVVETPAPAPVVETPAPSAEPTVSLSSARRPKAKK